MDEGSRKGGFLDAAMWGRLHVLLWCVKTAGTRSRLWGRRGGCWLQVRERSTLAWVSRVMRHACVAAALI